MPEPLPDLLGDLFRHRYAQLVASLCRGLGPGHLDLVEDVVQEALLRALRSWPATGVPEQPEAWVFRVARNLAVDTLRRHQTAARRTAELPRPATVTVAQEPDDPASIADDTLRMLFLCSHPAVPADARVPLILKTVCGLGVPAIAAALLQKEATIAQRLVRAKAKLQRDGVAFVMPTAAELPARLELVLQVLYLLFNEGYRAHRGAQLVQGELVDEALRLAALLAEQPHTDGPALRALLALMLLLGARLPARTDAAGELLPLAAQDRSRWDRRWLQCGFHHFAQSLRGASFSVYHCEAAIASLHATAPTYAATDWPRILAEYDRLLQLAPSPIVALNRAIAVGKVHGAARALAAVRPLEHEPALADYFLLPTTIAHLHWELGDPAAAADALAQALRLPCSEPERRLLERRLQACRAGERPPPW